MNQTWTFSTRFDYNLNCFLFSFSFFPLPFAVFLFLFLLFSLLISFSVGRYCLSVNVIAFVYSGFQAYDLTHCLMTGKHVITNRLRPHFEFFMDQASCATLVSIYHLTCIMLTISISILSCFLHNGNPLSIMGFKFSSSVPFIFTACHNGL